jgi:hypothetical protein
MGVQRKICPMTRRSIRSCTDPDTARERANEIVSVIREIQAAGLTTLEEMATALSRRGLQDGSRQGVAQGDGTESVADGRFGSASRLGGSS